MTLGTLLVAVALSQPDAGTLPDGGVATPLEPSTNSVALLSAGGETVIVWVDERRRRAFGDARSAGVDLWANRLSFSGLEQPYGRLIYRQPPGVTVANPSLATDGTSVFVAWTASQAVAPQESIQLATLPGQGGLPVPVSTTMPNKARDLQLAWANQGAVFVWEDALAVRAHVSRPNPTDYVVANKSAGAAPLRPSVAALTSGANPAAVLIAQPVPLEVTLLSGGGTGGAFFQTDFELEEARLVGAGRRAAFIGTHATSPGATRNAYLVDHAAAQPLLGWPASWGLLAAAGANDVVHLLFRDAAGGVQVMRAEGVTGVPTLLSIQGAPVAIAEAPGGDTLVAALPAEGAEASGLELVQASRFPGLPLVHHPLVHGDDELGPSVAFRQPGDFAVAWTHVAQDGNRQFAYGAPGNAPNLLRLLDGEQAWLATSIDGVEGLNVVGPGGSAVYASVTAIGGVVGEAPVLSATRRLPFAALGERLAVQWSADDGFLRWGNDDGGTRSAQPAATLGRCAAWEAANARLWLPYWSTSDAGTALLGFAVIPDEVATNGQPAAFTALLANVPSTRSPLPPCLALQGRSGLVVSENGPGRVDAVRVTLGTGSSASITTQANALGTTGLPGANPVVAGGLGHWLVVSESVGSNAGIIQARWLLTDGGLRPVAALSTSTAEARNPTAVASTSGDVLVAWQEFNEAGAHAEVRWQLVTNPDNSSGADAGAGDGGAPDGGAPDGGPSDGGVPVMPADSGVPVVPDAGDDGGAPVTPDAGADAGLDPSTDGGSKLPPIDDSRVDFASCGCGADSASALALLALLALPRRRRRP